jgi:hypothetical protein
MTTVIGEECSPPPLKLIMRATLTTPHSKPSMTFEKLPELYLSYTFATIRFVPGATPVLTPLAPVPEIIPDT